MIDYSINYEENSITGTKTEPRNRKSVLNLSKSGRVPLSRLSQNNDVESEQKLKEQKITLSEPIHKIKVRTRIVQESFIKADELIVVKQPEAISKTINAKTITAKSLAKILDYDTLIDDELDSDEKDEHRLFRFLENEGRLSPEILKAFCKSVKIRSINMTNSYAGIVGDSGMLSEAKYSAVLCTKAIFSGFQQLLSMDFTNVKINDDELRYLIRLPKLQALGLSGTYITDKGLKYISTHSSFKKSLRCIKLCFIQGISDAGIKYLDSFANLKDVDLRGNNNITLSGCLQLISCTSFDNSVDFNVRLPQTIQDRLKELHIHYKILSCDNPRMILDPEDGCFETMTAAELRSQLKLHKQKYTDIYLNQDLAFLKTNIYSILKTRRMEETLYNRSQSE